MRDILASGWRMKRVLCGESSLTCGHSLTNGVDDSWLPAKLSPWGTEEFRGFDEPVAFPERPLPRGYERSLMEARCRVAFVVRGRVGRALSNTIPSYSSHWIVCFKRKHRAVRNLRCA